MRLSLTAAAAAGFLTAPIAFAQAPDAAPPAGPPRVFQAAGYSQLDITPGLCRNVSPQQTECVIPEMTAGRYLVQATATSTANAADAAQQITIQGGDTGCQAAFRGSPAAPWSVGNAHTFYYDCVMTVITDQALTISANYIDFHATKDPKGPTLSLRKMPWGGVLSAAGVAPRQ